MRAHSRQPVLDARAEEHGLPRIGISHPLVERQHAAELVQVLHLLHQRIRQKIIDHVSSRVSRKPRSEVPALLERPAMRTELDVRFRIFLNKSPGNANHRHSRSRNAQIVEKCCCDPLIRQNAAMLRIVQKLDYVKVAVCRLHKVRLCSATHLADQAAGIDGHWGEAKFSGRQDGAPKCSTLRDYMPEEKEPTPRQALNKDEVALELMRFIAVTTGYGKTSASAGFAGKAPKTTEEQVDALIQLYERCRAVVGK